MELSEFPHVRQEVCMKTILVAEGLKKYYDCGHVITKALDGVNLKISEGEFIAIIGSSGSGKSTLLHILGTLDNATEGTLLIDGENTFAMSEDEKTIFRRKKIGFIFQNFNLIPILSVYENVVLPLQLDNKRVDEQAVDNILEFLSIKDKKYSTPSTLSGGQQQRVAIARALIMEPAIILADEPTGNLDSKTSDTVIKLLKSASKEYGKTVLVITHSQQIAEEADRIIHIEDGKVSSGELL